MKEGLLEKVLLLPTYRGRFRRLVRCFIYLLAIAPTAILAIVSIYAAYINITAAIFDDKEKSARLVASNIEDRLDHLLNLGESFVHNEQFVASVKEGRWEEAITELKFVPGEFSTIERLFLADTSGTERADYPSLLGAVGKNFAHRDWYKGVTADWEPYISSAYQRAAEPVVNVIAVALPVQDEDGVYGILVMQVRLSTVLEWGAQLETRPGEHFDLVDQAGQLLTYSHSARESHSAAGNILQAQEMFIGAREVSSSLQTDPYTQEDFVYGYAPIGLTNWGIVVEEPVGTVFDARNRQLIDLILVYGILIIISLVVAAIILKTLNLLDGYRQKNRIFLESIGDGIIAIDRYWNITLMNAAAEQLTGWRESQVLGKPFRAMIKFVTAEDRKENIRFIEETMLFGQTQAMENDTLLISRDGKDIPVADSCAPIISDSGTVIGAIIIFRNVAKERELAQLRKEFVSLASHELRTPITVVKGYADMLLNGDAGQLTPAQTRIFEDITDAVEKMNMLVNGMLNVSRIDLGTVAIDPQPEILDRIFEDILKEFKPVIEQKRINVNRIFEKSVGAIDVDPKIMSVVLRNLISNAVKFTPDEGTITLGYSQEEEMVKVFVRDTGMGIPKRQQGKIFQKLFRASNAAGIEGTGLGLYTAKKVLEQAECTIWFESEENAGTTFYVSIPLTGMTKKEGIQGLT